mmetsp:Transcript_20331/g.45188  ORF Transcript_20331/g.45188 Transcript_20331/m.45188 type:complete len:329 (+) Transcript_20331:39-1025(+)
MADAGVFSQELVLFAEELGAAPSGKSPGRIQLADISNGQTPRLMSRPVAMAALQEHADALVAARNKGFHEHIGQLEEQIAQMRRELGAERGLRRAAETEVAVMRAERVSFERLCGQRLVAVEQENQRLRDQLGDAQTGGPVAEVAIRDRDKLRAELAEAALHTQDVERQLAEAVQRCQGMQELLVRCEDDMQGMEVERDRLWSILEAIRQVAIIGEPEDGTVEELPDAVGQLQARRHQAEEKLGLARREAVEQLAWKSRCEVLEAHVKEAAEVILSLRLENDDLQDQVSKELEIRQLLASQLATVHRSGPSSPGRSGASSQSPGRLCR